ncbi:MAG: 23S rRNA (uracil(1939)-C(5))-methyltransferase RlmD [Bacilli bacterium]|nr:23S rRNA (uracil(1939)-C(5))-methyltransferase RlmD [Bacilli bacterium]
MKMGNVYVVEIESLEHSGRGVCHIDGRAVFVENALPTEKVEIKISVVKKNFAEAIVTQYIEESKKRINPNCPYYKECGGCQIRHLDVTEQRLYKENKVKEILLKFAGIDDSLIKPILFTEEAIGYRNKITLKVDKKIGFYKRKSNKIVPIQACSNAHPKINETLEYLNDYLPLENIDEIIIRISESTLENMVVLHVTGKIDEEYITRVLGEFVSTIIVHEYNKYYPIKGNSFITEKIGPYKFKVSAESFFQVNSKCTEVLYEKVLEYASLTETEIVLDLYCGTGTIGIYLSKLAKEVLGIELNRYAYLDALANKERNAVKNIQFLCKDASKVNERDKAGVVIVDPPRAGLDAHTISFLKETKPSKIVYVSCDPVTLARDIKLLSSDFEIKEITPVDMFPNTYHTECVTLLQLKKS